MANKKKSDLERDLRKAGQHVRDKANETAGRVKQGVADLKDDMDLED